MPRPEPVEDGYIGLGTNLGDREGHLRQALLRLRSRFVVRGLSSVYETEPAGFTAQPRFLNMVARCGGPPDPRLWVRACLEIEADMGRSRSFRDAPRVIDLDVLLVGDRVVDEPGARVPHPRMGERAFVLVPLLELAPDLRHPESGRPLAELPSARSSAGEAGVVRVMSGEELLENE